MNSVIFSQRQSFVIKDKVALLEKTVSIEPKSIDVKQKVWQDVSNLLESAKRLEINFNEFFLKHRR